MRHLREIIIVSIIVGVLVLIRWMQAMGVWKRVAEFFRALWQKIRGFFSDIRNEMRKVTFPNFKEVRATTVVVIITVFLFALFFWGIDLILNQALDKWVFHHPR